MNIVDVQDQLAARLQTISNLRVHAYPPDRVSPPAAIVSWPDSCTFDETYQRGVDRMTLPVVLLVPKVSDRAARTELAAYCDGSGARSIKQVLDSGSFSNFRVRVQSVVFDVVAFNGTDYSAANFSVDVVGNGV